MKRKRNLAKLYRTFIILLASVVLICLIRNYSLQSYLPSLSLAKKILLLGVLIIAFRLGWKAFATGQIRAIDALYYSLIVIFNPLILSALVILGESQKYFYTSKKVYQKNIPFEISKTLLVFTPSGIIYYHLSNPDILSNLWYNLSQNLIAFILAVLVSFLVNSIFENTDKIIQKRYPITYLNNLHPVKTKIYLCVLAPLGLGIGAIFKLNPLAWILFLLPWIVIIKTLSQYLDLLDESQIALKSIAEIVDKKNARDKYHSLKVAQYSQKVALQLKLNEYQIQEIANSAILHDLGKISIYDEILNKQEPLSEEENSLIKKHPVVGAYIINHLDFMHQIALNVKHHHENFNGTGYPDNLKENKIPLGARIIAVAEAFRNMIYPKILSKKEILNKIKSAQNTQFDPQIVKAFEKVLEKK